MTGAGADADDPPLCCLPLGCDGALTTRSAGWAGAACWTDAAGWATDRDAVALAAVTNCECGTNGTSVGKGARLINRVAASACDAVCDAVCGAVSNVEDCAAGCASFALSNAQPPSVAASEAAAMNVFTLGVSLDLERDLAGGM